MKEELKYILMHIVNSLSSQGALKISAAIKQDMNIPQSWKCITEKHQIVNQDSMWCYEYVSINDEPEIFLQIELNTHFKTVVAINVIMDEKNKVIEYK